MTDRPGENRPAPFFGLGADLKALAGAIGWLAGAMSGVVALMYAVGFLCAKSHLYMLGIETHSGVPAGAYVEIGAKFFYITLIMLFDFIVDLGRALMPALAVVSLVAAAIIATVVTVVARIRRIGRRNLLEQWWKASQKIGPDALPTQIFLISCLALVVFWAGRQYAEVFAPVHISGLLHQGCVASPEVTGATEAELIASGLACAIRNQEHKTCHTYYAGVVNIVFVLFLVVVPFRQRLLRRKATRALHLVLLLLFLIYSLVLPLIYGALVMPNDFPRVYVHAGKDSQVRIPEGSFHLIHQGEKYLILWHADKAASYVIPCSGVTTLEVLGRASVFAGQPPT